MLDFDANGFQITDWLNLGAADPANPETLTK
jgi:hypothetical protein